MKDPVVSADWLVDNLDDVVVLDATYYLPADPERSQRDFETARVPGARMFEIDVIADRANDLPHMLPDAETFGKAMAALGMSGTRPIVVYDRSANHFSAPRVWFTLKLFGIDDVFVLDGGLNAWVAAGQPTDAGPARLEPVPVRVWTMDQSRVKSGAEMAERVKAGRDVILDARARARFDGEAPEPRPGLRSGHMPGSVCVPFTALTRAGGHFANRDELQDIFADSGDDPIVSCGSGMTACVLALGLARIGRRARLYDGSWADWGRGDLGDIVTTG